MRQRKMCRSNIIKFRLTKTVRLCYNTLLYDERYIYSPMPWMIPKNRDSKRWTEKQEKEKNCHIIAKYFSYQCYTTFSKAAKNRQRFLVFSILFICALSRLKQAGKMLKKETMMRRMKTFSFITIPFFSFPHHLVHLQFIANIFHLMAGWFGKSI